MKTLTDAINFAEQEKFILVFRPTINLDPQLEKLINTTEANLVAWAHVNPSQATLRKLATAASVKRVIALGGRQYMTWIDNPVKRKSQIIKNGQYLPKDTVIIDSSVKYVSYLGSIVPQKGFHLLAKVWPKIHRKYPNLRLKVIGSGSLYDPNTKLGKHGIAEQRYEDIFMKNFGSSIVSVDFLGKLNAVEKNQVVANSYIGIVNPSGNTENCPASALDFEAYEVPVISVFKFGLIDTVSHGKTGILVKNYKRIPGAIALLLESVGLRTELSRNCRSFLSSEFDFVDISQEWIKIFQTLDSQSPLKMQIKDLVSFREYISFIYAKLTDRLSVIVPMKTTQEMESNLRSMVLKLLFRK
jgi:glycosyltransferase involved in cell wall biosynthesis